MVVGSFYDPLLTDLHESAIFLISSLLAASFAALGSASLYCVLCAPAVCDLGCALLRC